MAKAAKAATKVEIGQDGEPYFPEFAQPTSKQAPAQLVPTPPFVLQFHRERFTVMRGRVIPRLRKWPLVEGVNGIERDKATKKLRVKEAMAHAEERAKGNMRFVPIDVDGPGTSYIQRPKGNPHVHLLKYERSYPGSTRIDCDELGYIAWCDELRAKGAVDAPELRVLEAMRADVERDIEELVSKDRSPSVVKRLQKDLAAIDAEIREAAKREGRIDEIEAVDPLASTDAKGAAA